LFANRLGTETPNAESGTVEEIERLHRLGRYVAILRSVCPVDATKIDLGQARRLQDYLQSLQGQALILEYAGAADLQAHVDTILNAAVSRDTTRAELQLEIPMPTDSEARVAEVWPRVSSDETIGTDSRGRVRSRRRSYLAVSNVG
jgi:hypothetical protein